MGNDFESHDGMTEENLYQKIFATHFGHVAIIFLWASSLLFHVAWQGNFEQWIKDPLHIRPIAHAIWDPHFGKPAIEAFTQGGANHPVNIAYSGVYHWWYTIGMRTNNDLYQGSVFLLLLAALFLFAGWLHLQPKYRPSLAWFKSAEPRLNHHLAGLFGVSSLAWAGHLVHVAIPESRGVHVGWNNFLTTLPHPAGLAPFWRGDWGVYAQNPDTAGHLFGTSQGAGTAILTFLGGFHPQTESLWLTDMAHHHLAIAVIFIVAGHQYRTNFGIGHSIKEMLNARKFFGIQTEGQFNLPHQGLYDTYNNSLHFQLSIHLAALGTALSLVAQHMYSMPPYAFMAKDYTTQAALYTHHQYIAGFLMIGAFAHAGIFWVRDYDPEQNKGNVLERVLQHKEAIISHLSWVSFGPGDFLVHHAIALGLHTTTLICVKGALDARGTKLMPDKKDFGYTFPCDGPGRGGTCQTSSWEQSFYLAMFWMLNLLGWVTFYWHWKHLGVWQGNVAQFNENSTYLMGWFRDYLWANSAQLINGYNPYGTNNLSVWAWMFLFGHLVWATGFMFLISWRGYWQELIETLVWAHERTPLANLVRWKDKPVALSIVQGWLVGLAHFTVGYILTYGAFLIASTASKFG